MTRMFLRTGLHLRVRGPLFEHEDHTHGGVLGWASPLQ